MVRLPRKGVLEGLDNLLPWSIKFSKALIWHGKGIRLFVCGKVLNILDGVMMGLTKASLLSFL
jgi:hypothetical protein